MSITDVERAVCFDAFICLCNRFNRRACRLSNGLLTGLGVVGMARRRAPGGHGGGNSPFAAAAAAPVVVHFGVRFVGDEATRTNGSGPPLIVSIGCILFTLKLRGVSGTGCCWSFRRSALSSKDTDDEASSATAVLIEILNDGVVDGYFLGGLSRNCIGNGDDNDLDGGITLFGDGCSISTG